jgi:hypothetical protein
LLWVITNRPQGDSFKNWNSNDPVHVGIEFDDGWVSKDRINNKNTYEIEEGKLEAVRSDVPNEIQNITKITEYNLQTQHGSYFLLQDTPGEVAKKLNELVGLDVIDRIYKNLNSKITDSKSRIKITNERITDLEENVKKLSYLAQISKIVKKLDSDIASLEAIENKQNSIKILMKKIVEINSIIESEKNILKSEPQTIILRKKILELKETSSKITNIKLVVKTIKEIESQNESELSWLSVENGYVSLKQQVKQFEEQEHKVEELGRLLKLVSKTSEKIEHNKIGLKKVSGQYLDILKEHKICPTCQSPITSTVIKQIEKGLSI